MKIDRHRHDAGYTLTEVIIAVAIFAIIFVSALAIYDQSNKIFRMGVEASDTQQNTRVAFDKVVSDVRMTGFDYDRDGIPVGSTGGTNVYQQPDEQVEYLGRHAITIRANFDYDSEGPPDFGRESGLESTQFPVVTTGNHEIVTYALVSETSSANDDTISFYADVPERTAYPGGDAETQVQIDEVDLSNANPPYTLYRITLDDDGDPVRTPLADNIRTIDFTYFEDATGSTALTAIDGTTLLDPEAIDTSVGGLGQYDPANPGALVTQRTIRSKVRSIIVNLIGMDESPDFRYIDPLETVTANDTDHKRKVRLEALVAPRNFAKRGMREQSDKPPGTPTVTKLCVGHCGIAYLEWTAPAASALFGAAEQFAIMYDIDDVGGFSYFQYVGPVTSGYVYGLDPGTEYFFAIQAINSYGSAMSETPYDSATPVNSTTPEPPSNLVATNTGDSTAQAGKVTLSWDLPAANDASFNTLSCDPSGTPTANWLPGEISGYRIYRDTTDDFTPSPSNLIHDWNDTSDLVVNYATSTATFEDDTVVACKTYYYRIQAVETCRDVVAYNTGGATGETAVIPSIASPAVEGDAVASGTAPAAPIALSVDSGASSCDSLSNTCIVKLDWPAVATDVDGNQVGIDDYEIIRQRRKDPNDPLIDDPLLAASPHVTNGVAQGASITFTDNTAEMVDLGDGLDWTYYYSVRALDCGTAGGTSPLAQYPAACSFAGSITVEAGATSGDGSVASPWVMNDGDSIEAIAPFGDTLAEVQFILYNSGGFAEDSSTVSSSPFAYGWVDRTDDELYRLVLTITNDSGCTEQLVRYIMDESVAPCVIGNESQFESSFTAGVGATDDISIWAVTINQTSGENLTPVQINLTWTDRPSTSWDATLDSISYDLASTDATDRSEGTTGLIAVPGGTQSIRDGVDYTIYFRFKAPKQRADDATERLANPIDKLCIVYQVPSEPSTNKYCNVVGAGSPSNNPDSCD